ncbi:Hypothetical predicted protein [Lecanosticta acicola]|uniref:Uncharacterized protein n=1 Tax=Lecanosticta acicola TaxID=111012 RepID=A0AAI8YZJ4_9PEZI|nr:Hypothetical predicted protein [Lecanosticta acicola]
MADDPVSPLLRLPTELRLRIYELAHDAKYISPRLTWRNDFTLHLYGSQDYHGQVITTSGSPFTLLRVCKQLYTEVQPMLPPIRSICFEFNDFSATDLARWLALLTPRQVSEIRKIKIFGWGKCQLRQQNHQNARENPSCDRSLLVDLSHYERTFNRTAFLSTVGRNPQTGGPRDSKFYRGFYLMRRLEGCVVIPKAYSHERNSVGQCNSVTDQQLAVAELITNTGEVNTTKEGIEGLLKAVLTDEIPGGPGVRRLGYS